MQKSLFESATSEFLAKADNLVAAAEIYNETINNAAGKPDDLDPVAAFLSIPENAKLARVVQETFPDSLRSVTKSTLFKGIREECSKKFTSSRTWKVVADPEDDHGLLNARWLEIFLEPKSTDGVYWGFGFSMDMKKIPFLLSHGIVSSERGGRPKAMRKELKLAVGQLEREFKKRRFNVTQNPNNGWFAQSGIPYREYAIGAHPALLAGIHTGDFAKAVAEEFVQLFGLWASKIEALNKML